MRKHCSSVPRGTLRVPHTPCQSVPRGTLEHLKTNLERDLDDVFHVEHYSYPQSKARSLLMNPKVFHVEHAQLAPNSGIAFRLPKGLF